MAFESERAEAKLPTRVLRLHPSNGDATVVADDLVRPNYLCFSQQESRLYITDSGNSHDPDAPGHIRPFSVFKGWSSEAARCSRIRNQHTPIACRRIATAIGRPP